MKSSQRLNYNRLADALAERNLIDRDVLNHVVQQCNATGALLPELLVNDGLVSDWEVSRVASEVFNLSYVPIDCYPPNEAAMSGIDPDFLRQYGLVPLDRFGALLTVAMPALVPSEVIESLAKLASVEVLPVIGSVKVNRRWLDDHLPPPAMPQLDDGSAPTAEGIGWENIFDAGEEAVQLNLQDPLDE